ncbi:ATP SYNTHASE ALPHA CHAIN [Mycoplasmopsis pulmonis]|uniref:ATP SYNTHASE ALPHA CHAIN n=1 Tax=Mycoplasmopsis pulmonis (strain UAB CTIP) TaxID=272635 RepID=Q98QX5_MYCPU|nr:ATP synthase subunit alpha [Mycoplasmopsis pulmonis]MDZ7293197.1 F0F1 ATP synthase subunit alpha [Mycoplasmopsis pulmonis]CAC13408.1 ATP SYNTHASE ALPHA CHAIN [Mycoplasmopsis pulmonis]
MITKLKITSIKDNIVTVVGNHPYKFLEVVKFSNKTQGIVLKGSAFQAEVGLVNVDSHNQLEVGSEAIATGELFKVKIHDNLIGSVVDVSLNEVLTFSKRGQDDIAILDVFEEAKPIYSRKAVNAPLETGITAIDAVLPIGRGQKQLIIGDKGTGKTAIALNAILAQEKSNVISIYAAVGKKREEVVEIFSVLKSRKLMDKTIIISSSADDLAVTKYLLPYVSMSVAEHYQSLGRDVLVVIDDLTNHADAYREISLLSGSAPGREAYPGDIFYTHSRLLERAGKFSDEFGGGSITCIPIAQTLASDISGYIPTNLISITDGQIFTSTKLFNSGKRPAIDIGLSVSRIGSIAQKYSMIQASKGLKTLITEFLNQKKLSSVLTERTKRDLEKMELGWVFEALMDQREYEVVEYHTTTILLFLLKKGYLSFYWEKTKELVLIKDILKTFLSKDIMGNKLRMLLDTHELEAPIIDLYLKHFILPLLKYHLLTESVYLSKNTKFIKKFNDIRNDGRVLLSYERKGLEKGIAYDYK